MLDTHFMKFELKEKKTLAFINHLCMKNGSTYQGRKEFACKLLKIRKKVPILINDRDKIILFPLQNIKHRDCMWINYQTVKKVSCSENGMDTLICFGENTLRVPMEQRSVRMQMARCRKMIIFLESEENLII